MRQTKYRFFLLPLIFVLACAGAFAQANSDVTGIITDQTGAVVPDAKYHTYRSGYRHCEVHREQRHRTVRHFRFERRQLQHEGHGKGL